MQVTVKPPYGGALRIVHWSAAAAVLAAAYAYLHSSLNAIANFGLLQPFSDHYRIYANFFSHPLYEAIFGIENAHRPVIAALVRYVELRWLNADQRLQLMFGSLLAVATVSMLAVTAWRERSLSPAARAAGVFVAVASVLWFANARMLFHGGEAMHVYPVTFCTAIAVLAMYAAATSQRHVWLAAAGLACTVATFSFGSGVASFASVFVAALYLRFPWQRYAILAIFLVLAVLLYIVILPGNDGVRGSFVLDPAAMAIIALRCLGAPWIVADHSRLLVGPGQLTIATGIGAAGVTMYIALFVCSLRATPSRLSVIGLGMATLGLTTAMLIGVTRNTLMIEAPSQALADRYLAWSCQFWGGLMLAAIACAKTPWRGLITATGTIALAFSLWLAHVDTMIWAAIVHRTNERSGIAARLGIWDGTVFPNRFDASRDQTLFTIERFRALGLGMFRCPVPVLLTLSRFATSSVAAAPSGSEIRIANTFYDTLGNRIVVRIEGAFAHGTPMPRDTALEIVDDHGFVHGEAVLDHFDDYRVVRWNRRPMRGFDGYVPLPVPGMYRLLLIDRTAEQAMFELPFRIAPADLTTGKPVP